MNLYKYINLIVRKKDETELNEIELKISFSAEIPKDAQDVLTEYEYK